MYFNNYNVDLFLFRKHDDAARYGLSVTAHCALVASTVSAINGEDEPVSISTVRRQRFKQLRRSVETKSSFYNNFKGYPKIVHWDGKVMSITSKKGTEKEDINAVVLTVPGTSHGSKTIGIPSVEHGTGAALASSTLSVAEEWTPIEDIVG